MTPAEYQRETNVHGNRAHSPLPKDVEEEHRKISRADGLAFVFPLWWSDGPAVLKGWFDRVWVCGSAYDYGIPRRDFPVPVSLDPQSARSSPRWRYGGRSGAVGCCPEHEADLYTNDRLHPGAGVAHSEFIFLPGMADPQIASRARELNLGTAYRLGRNFLTVAAD